MLVTAMRAYRVRVQPTDPIRTGRGPVSARADLLVELVTDDGRSGWGNGSDSESSIAALAGAAPHVLGLDPSRIDPRVLWATLREALPIGPLSAVDTALWDLRGQALGQSVAALLGAESGHVRPQVRAYATGLFRRERWTDAEHARELVLEAEGYAAAGYTAMKLKTGFGLAADTRHTAAIRHAIGPDIALYVDSNAAYSPAAVHCIRRSNRRLRRWLDGRTHPPTRLGRLSSGPRGARKSLRANPRRRRRAAWRRHRLLRRLRRRGLGRGPARCRFGRRDHRHVALGPASPW